MVVYTSFVLYQEKTYHLKYVVPRLSNIQNPSISCKILHFPNLHLFSSTNSNRKLNKCKFFNFENNLTARRSFVGSTTGGQTRRDHIRFDFNLHEIHRILNFASLYFYLILTHLMRLFIFVTKGWIERSIGGFYINNFLIEAYLTQLFFFLLFVLISL